MKRTKTHTAGLQVVFRGLKPEPGAGFGPDVVFFKGLNGFTLVEVVVAMVILSVGFMTMAGVAASVMRGNAHSSRMTTATTLAQEKMEEIRRSGYSGIPDAETTTVEDYESIAHYNSYKRVVSTAATHAADGIKMVTVTVCWDSGSRRVVLKTILAE
jgi:type IV pilus assembly protein PilV